MRILGIDPGTATTGYGVIDAVGSSCRLLDYGCIHTKAKTPMPDRLVKLAAGMEELLITWQPGVMAVEELFFNTNTTTAISVGQARGVILLAGAQKKLEIYEYTPLQVKQALVGYGRAEKQQIQYMVKTYLHMTELPKPDDAADALAIAICHAHYFATRRMREIKE